MKSNVIRQQFIDFFKDKGHSFVRSGSVVPTDDQTLLFTNAGMNQFKPVFLNQESPKVLRATNSQKCIRVSGKHNDLEEVGVDNYHHTFFEMLGNWSFGDYYKEDAIAWAWELITKVWKMDKRRLWVSIYKEDEESKKIWLERTDIPENRVLKFGKKDNFWEMGDTGPCGPCTEIHYYVGDDILGQSSKGVNCEDDYREFWNLVFIQYNRDSNGKLNDLPNKHVDTGAGFERVVSIMNLKKSNYETDLFVPLIEEIEKISGKSKDFERGVAHRVISDHIRMLVFSLADGAIPSNDGRGYVLRRILRRASRFGRTLGLKDPFLYKLVEVLSGTMGEFYTELNGYVFDNKLQFRTAFGTNKEVPKINRYFEGVSRSIIENWQYTDSLWYGDDWFYLDSQLVSIDTLSNQIETMLYQRSKSFTFPLDFTYSLNNGYSVGLGFAYQERYKENVKRGNAGGFYNYADSTWIVNDINNPNVYDNQTTSNYPNEIPFQINRMVSISVGKASKWAITLNYDWTNVQEIVTTDPKYNPLEALIYGDIKYFTGDRDENIAPSFTKNKWVALEFSYNLTSTQRISFLYGSIQGGLVCSNGICRILQPFNDGLKLSYSAIF